MSRRLRKIQTWLAEPTRNSRGMTILVWLVLATTTVGGAYGALTYVRNESEERREAVVAQCVQRVESRAQVRGVLLGLAVRLGADDDTVLIVSSYLDEEYPALDPTDCTKEIPT